MTIPNQIFAFFLILIIATLVYLLSPILTPFLLGALLAYLANPLVKKLESYHVPQLLSVIVVFSLIFSVILLLILMVIPLVKTQIGILASLLPKMIAWLQTSVIPHLSEYIDAESLRSTVASKSTAIFGTVIKSGYAVLSWTIDIILTPIVTFYLLRDWDLVLKAAKNSLPKSSKSNVMELAKESDEVLSGFVRGQLMVMLALCFIYGIGLSLTGLEGGFTIGIIGGLLSIVPYLGSAFVLVFSVATAMIQFDTWHSVALVLIVFLVGQSIEAWVLTPYLIGNRIGLHPVAVIFAIMAGGTLFGFCGVLLALPVAAVIMVMLRFLYRKHYVRT